MNYVNDAAVIPYSVYEAVEMIPDAEMRALTYKMLILNALNDNAEVTGNPMVDMVLTMARPTQISTAQRYQKARENGQKGGRPSKISRDVVFELRQRGYTQTQIASALDCHVNSIRNILRGDETITDNNLEKEIEVKKEEEKEVEVEVEATDATKDITGQNQNTLPSTTAATTYPPVSLNIRYFSGDVIYNLIRIFGKERYYAEQKEKYLGYVSRVFPKMTEGQPLINITCALISLRIRNIKINRTSNSDSFGYWVIDALHHLKDYNILTTYRIGIMNEQFQEKKYIEKLEGTEIEIKEEKEEQKDDEEYEEEDEDYDDYDDGLPF